MMMTVVVMMNNTVLQMHLQRVHTPSSYKLCHCLIFMFYFILLVR